jgi:predicted transposase YdaD
MLNANVDRQGFDEKVKLQHSESLTKLAMTLADRIREEGLQKGLQKGRQEGRQEGEIHSRRQALLDVLELRFAPIPEGLREALSGVSELGRLEKLLKVAVVCPDLEAFASTI